MIETAEEKKYGKNCERKTTVSSNEAGTRWRWKWFLIDQEVGEKCYGRRHIFADSWHW
jgi:hypothetical protein